MHEGIGSNETLLYLERSGCHRAARDHLTRISNGSGDVESEGSLSPGGERLLDQSVGDDAYLRHRQLRCMSDLFHQTFVYLAEELDGQSSSS